MKKSIQFVIFGFIFVLSFFGGKNVFAADGITSVVAGSQVLMNQNTITLKEGTINFIARVEGSGFVEGWFIFNSNNTNNGLVCNQATRDAAYSTYSNLNKIKTLNPSSSDQNLIYQKEIYQDNTYKIIACAKKNDGTFYSSEIQEFNVIDGCRADLIPSTATSAEIPPFRLLTGHNLDPSTYYDEDGIPQTLSATWNAVSGFFDTLERDNTPPLDLLKKNNPFLEVSAKNINFCKEENSIEITIFENGKQAIFYKSPMLFNTFFSAFFSPGDTKCTVNPNGPDCQVYAHIKIYDKDKKLLQEEDTDIIEYECKTSRCDTPWVLNHSSINNSVCQLKAGDIRFETPSGDPIGNSFDEQSILLHVNTEKCSGQLGISLYEEDSSGLMNTLKGAVEGAAGGVVDDLKISAGVAGFAAITGIGLSAPITVPALLASAAAGGIYAVYSAVSDDRISMKMRDGKELSKLTVYSDRNNPDLQILFKTTQQNCELHNKNGGEDPEPDCVVYASVSFAGKESDTALVIPLYKQKNYWKGDKSFMNLGILIGDCSDGQCKGNDDPWQVLDVANGSFTENPGPAEIIGGQQYIDKNSLCYDGNGGYLENCYEFLAPIQGFDENAKGEKLKNVKSENGRMAITNLSDYQLGDYVNKIFQIAVAILGVISVIMIVIAGVQYMTVESIYGKSDAKQRIGNAVGGLILSVGIYLILWTINPHLLEVNFGSGIKEVSVGMSALDPKYLKDSVPVSDTVDFNTALSKKLTSNKNEYKIAYEVADSIGIPNCIAKVVLDRESGGNIEAIGHDEDVTVMKTTSHKAFMTVSKKFSGASRNSDTKNDDHNIDKTRNDLGLDWRFSHGIGLTQITLFPKQYGKGYLDWVKTDEAFQNRKDNYRPRKVGGKTYHPKDLLDLRRNIEAGLGLWKVNYAYCGKSVQGAFNRYLTGKCNKDSSSGEGAKRTNLYNQCVNGN